MKRKLEIVDSVLMDDIKKYIVGASSLSEEENEQAIANFLAFSIMPKSKSVPVAQKGKTVQEDVVGSKLRAFSHLSEEEKARLYKELNTDLEAFFLQDLSSNGVNII